MGDINEVSERLGRLTAGQNALEKALEDNHEHFARLLGEIKSDLSKLRAQVDRADLTNLRTDVQTIKRESRHALDQRNQMQQNLIVLSNIIERVENAEILLEKMETWRAQDVDPAVAKVGLYERMRQRVIGGALVVSAIGSAIGVLVHYLWDYFFKK